MVDRAFVCSFWGVCHVTVKLATEKDFALKTTTDTITRVSIMAAFWTKIKSFQWSQHKPVSWNMQRALELTVLRALTFEGIKTLRVKMKKTITFAAPHHPILYNCPLPESQLMHKTDVVPFSLVRQESVVQTQTKLCSVFHFLCEIRMLKNKKKEYWNLQFKLQGMLSATGCALFYNSLCVQHFVWPVVSKLSYCCLLSVWEN